MTRTLYFNRQVNPDVGSSVDFAGLRLSLLPATAQVFFFFLWISNTGGLPGQFYTFLFLCPPFFFPFLLTKKRNENEEEDKESTDWFLERLWFLYYIELSVIFDKRCRWLWKKSTGSIQPRKGYHLARADDPHCRWMGGVMKGVSRTE